MHPEHQAEGFALHLFVARLVLFAVWVRGEGWCRDVSGVLFDAPGDLCIHWPPLSKIIINR